MFAGGFHQLAELGDVAYPGLAQGQDYVSGLDASLGGGARGVQHQEAAAAFDLGRLALAQGTQGQAHLAAVAAVRGALLFVSGNFRQGHGLGQVLAVPQQAQIDPGTRGRVAHQAGQVVGVVNGLAVEAEDHVSGLEACLVRRAILIHGRHHYAAGFG